VQRNNVIIGFSGGTGAGKTTLVNYAAEILGKENTLVLSQDHYYKHLPELSFSERCTINFDHPDALDFDLFIKHVEQLKYNKPIERPVYSFTEHLRQDEIVICTPKKYILVEGILIFSNLNLYKQFDYTVFIKSSSDLRVARRIARDVATRGRTAEEVTARFSTTIHKMHEQFVAPNEQKSDIVIENNEELAVAKKRLKKWLEKIIL